MARARTCASTDGVVRHVRGIYIKKKDKKKNAFQESSALQLWSARACLLQSFLEVPTELLRGRKPCLEKLPDDKTWGCRAPSNHTLLCLLKVHLQGRERGCGWCVHIFVSGGESKKECRRNILLNAYKYLKIHLVAAPFKHTPFKQTRFCV